MTMVKTRNRLVSRQFQGKKSSVTSLYYYIAIALVILLQAATIVTSSDTINIIITNESDYEIEVGWYDPRTNILSDGRWNIQSGGGKTPLNSFEGHRFGVLQNSDELIGTILVTGEAKQQFMVTEGLDVLKGVKTSKAPYVSPWEYNVNRGEVKVLFLNEDDEQEFVLRVVGSGGEESSVASGKHVFLQVSVGETVAVSSRSGESSLVSVGGSSQQAVFLRSMSITHVDVAQPSKKLSKEDYSKIKKAELRELLSRCEGPGVCMQEITAAYLLHHSQELEHLTTARGFISDAWENYTCNDSSLATSPALEETVFNYHNTSIEVQVLHSRPSSQVHLLHNFITAEECEAIENLAERHLQPAATEGDEPGKPSKSRKALQAAVDVPYSNDTSPVTTLARRVIAYANHATEFTPTLKEYGQEPLMSIQYKGNGPNDPFPDQYLPHCDGACDGQPYQQTGRVATMVLYCKVPDLGGATNFKNSGIHVVPQVGSGLFFSYINLSDLTMDPGFTTHSGCPVIHGRKKLVTQWLRQGVALDKPYTDYSAEGNKYAAPEAHHCDNPFYSDYPRLMDELPLASQHTCPFVF